TYDGTFVERFFFPSRRRHTRSKRDWSSDVCSSDLGGQWREHIAPLPATQNYVEALRKIGAEQDGAAALAHHYVRYLSDMSGGQVIARMFEQYYGLDERSTSFYDFDAIGRIKPYRDRYRITLNQLELGAEDKERIIDCASTAFAMNQAVFQALAEQHVR